MDNAAGRAGLASLFDLGTGTGDPRLDAALGMQPISEAEIEQELASRQTPYGEQRPYYSGAPVSKDTIQRAQTYLPTILQASAEHNVDPSLMMALIGAESSFNPKALSPKEAMGLGQMIPGTFKKYGEGNPYDPMASARASAKYMRHLLDMFGGDERLAVAAYNAGEGAVKKHGGIPPYAETQKYTKDVLGTKDQYTSLLGGAPSQTPSQAPQEIPPGIKPQLLSTGETIGVPEHLSIEDIAALLQSKGEKGIPVKPYNAPNGDTVAVPYNLNDEQIRNLLRQKAPELLTKPGMPEPDKSGYTAAAKQSLVNTLGQMGVAGGTALEKMGADELGPKMKEWGLTKEEAAKGMYEKPPEGQESWFKENIGIPFTQGAAGLVPLAPAMMLPGGVGLAATAGAVGLQEAGALEQRAREEGKPIEDWGKAMPTVAGATALNLFPVKAISPLFKAASKDLILGSKEAVQKIIEDKGIDAAKEIIGSRVGNILKQAGITEVEGLGADIGTSLLERSYLNKPLWDDEAKQEYIDIAKQGAAFYPAAGGGAGFVQHHAAATEVQRAQEQQDVAQKVAEQQAREEARSVELAAQEAKAAPKIEIPEDIAALNLPPKEAVNLARMQAEQEAAAKAEEERAAAPPEPEKPYYDLLGLKNRKRNVAYNALKQLDPADPTHTDTINQVLNEIENKGMPRNQAAISELRQKLSGDLNAFKKQEAAEPDVSGGAQSEIRQEGEGATEGGEGVRYSRQKAGETQEVKSAAEMFEPESIAAAKDVEYKDHEKLIEMPIDDFLKLAENLPEETEHKRAGVEEALGKGELLRNIPRLWVAEGGGGQHVVKGHEGRHRALALARRGYTHMPVRFKHGDIRWTEQQDPNLFDYKEQWPETLKGQQGDILPFPVSRGEAETSYSPAAKEELLKGADGKPVVLYRGGVGKETLGEDFMQGRSRQGYATFASTSPYVAGSYAHPDEFFPTQAGGIVPLHIYPKKVFEFPVKDGRFDKYEFDRRAKMLAPGDVLVARGAVDIGPRASLKTDPARLYSYGSDVYAWGKGTKTSSPIAKDEPRFARETPQGAKPLTKGEITSQVKQLSEKWKNAPSIKISTFDELPAHIKEAAGESVIPAVYDNGTVHLIEGNLKSPEHVQEALFHESYGHHGLRQLLGKELASHLNNIYQKIGGDEGLRKYAEKYKFDMDEYDKATKEFKPAMRNAMMTEELLAHIAQEKPSLRAAVRATYGALRNALRKLGFDKLMEYSDAELSHLMSQAAKTIKKGVKQEVAPTEPRFARTPEETLKEAGLAGKIKQKNFGDKFGEAARDMFKEGRHTTLHTEYFDAQSGIGKALKGLPTLIDKTARGDFIYSAHAQRGNAIQNSYHDGYLTIGPDGTLHGVQNAHLALKNIFQKVKDYKGDKDPIDLFNQMVIALRGRTIREQDKAIRKQADDLLVKAGLLEAHANTQKSATKIARYIRSADNLRKIAEERLARINYDTGRTRVTDEQVRAAEEAERNHPELAKQAQNIYSLMQKQVDLWHDSGLIDSATAKEWKEYANYVPFYKTEEYEKMMIDPSEYIDNIARKMGRGSKSLPVVHEQRTHQHKIYLESNLLRHIAFMASAASENSARKNTLKQMEMVGKAEVNPAGKKGENVVMFKDNGKKQFFKVDDPNAYYALQAAQPIINPLVRRMKKVAGFARGMMIMNPLFWYRQLAREPMQASLVGRVGMITPFDTMSAITKIMVNKSAAYKDLKGRGIVGAVDVVSDPAEFVKNIEKGKSAVDQGIGAIKHIHEVVDAATRVVAYERAVEQGLKQGMDAETAKDYGAVIARELINFSKQGRSQTIRALRATTPFFGAALNSLEVLAKAMAPENIGNLSKAEAMEARRIFYSNAAMVAMFTTAYAMFMSDDDDYLKTPDRAANWLVPTEDKKTPFTKTSIPFEAGFGVKVIPELIALYNMGAITTKEAMQEAGKAAWDLVVPPMPTVYAIEPLVEAMINHDFHTGHAIESGLDENAPVEYRDKKAGELMKLVGKKLEDSGVNFPRLSPDKLEHIANGYMGQVWAITRVASDAMLRPEGTGVEKTLADYPITSGIYVKGTKDRAVNQFYEISKEVEDANRILTSSGQRGNAERFEELGKSEKYQKLLRAYPAVSSIKKDMGDKMATIERVKNDKSLTPEERTTRIDRLTEEYDTLANRGMEAARRLKIVE